MIKLLSVSRAGMRLSVSLSLMLTLPAAAQQPLPGPLERGTVPPAPPVATPAEALPPGTPIPGAVVVEEEPKEPPKILLAPPPTPLEIQMQRTGHPRCISCCAKPSDNGQYVGYYVGGGCPFWKHAQPHLAEEGTWGWDYSGCCLHRCVILGWWHGKPQGGRGAYRVDGPSLIHHIQEKKALKEEH